jgi:hypothetical protein
MDGGACSGQGVLAGGWRYGRGGGRPAAPRRAHELRKAMQRCTWVPPVSGSRRVHHARAAQGDAEVHVGPTCIGEKTQKEPTVTVGWRWTVRIVSCGRWRSASCKVIGWVRMVCCGRWRSASCILALLQSVHLHTKLQVNHRNFFTLPIHPSIPRVIRASCAPWPAAFFSWRAAWRRSAGWWRSPAASSTATTSSSPPPDLPGCYLNLLPLDHFFLKY